MKLGRLLKLVDLIRTLRAPVTGCAWTSKQNMQTLAPMTIEESYELADAVLEDNPEKIKNELGDLLYHVLFYTEIARENDLFDLDDVANAMIQKHEKRMPPGYHEMSADEINAHWQQKKQQKTHSIAAEMPASLPTLQRATKLQNRAADVGFDWPNATGALDKLYEEIQELQDELKGTKNKKHIQNELGDILFSAINLTRHLGEHPEVVLSLANRKFIKRIQYIEDQLASCGETFTSSNLEKLERLWQDSKRTEHDQ